MGSMAGNTLGTYVLVKPEHLEYLEQCRYAVEIADNKVSARTYDADDLECLLRTIGADADAEVKQKLAAADALIDALKIEVSSQKETIASFRKYSVELRDLARETAAEVRRLTNGINQVLIHSRNDAECSYRTTSNGECDCWRSDLSGLLQPEQT